MSYRTRPLAAPLALSMALVWLPLLAGSADAVAAPVITLEDDLNCNGILPNDASENTTKRLDPTFASDFNPGGVIGYVIDFPVDPDDVNGDFKITDCVLVGDDPIAKYTIAFVPNSTDFHLQFSIEIPEDTPLGSQFCNYAKTTQSPSASPASNRKAGPACFTVGGGLRIEKRTGSTTGPILPGATFTVACTPVVSSPPTIITGLSNASTGTAVVTASGVATDGTIAINGPSGTPCVVTETAAPDGYLVDPTPRNLVIPVGTSQTINVFVNHQLGSLSVSKTAVGAGGTFSYAVSCDDGGTYEPFQITVAAGATETHVVSESIVVGTECTVTETADPLFSTQVTPSDGTATVDADGETVAFTNTRLTGSLVVNKSANEDGTFSFDVDCDGTAYDTTLQITTVNGSGSASIPTIPTGTSCTVTEQAHALFSSVRVPTDGTVVIATGDNTVSFTNTRLVGRLVVAKNADMDGTFHFTVDCDGTAYDTTRDITTSGGTGSASVDNIPTGTSCTVTEASDPQWTVTVTPGDGTVSIAQGDNTVSFVNARVRGRLVIAKTSDVDGTFTFTVDCDGTAYDTTREITTANGAGSASVDGIPTGTSCTVTEASSPAWSVVVTPGNGTVVIGTGDNEVGFANTRTRGSLTITKATDVDSVFTFDVDCTDDPYDASDVTISTAEGAGVAVIDGIPTGTVCTVTEDDKEGWSQTLVVPAGGSVTIDAGGETVAFTNARDRGTLIVTKAITDATDGGPYAFTFHVTCAGTALPDFQLGSGELGLEKQIGGIPTGNVCTVTEDSDPTWSTVVTPSDGMATIGAQPVTVAFANTKLYTDTSFGKSADPASGTAVTDGDTITYTLHYANAGNTAATVTITDEVPDGTTYVDGSAGDGVVAGGTITWVVEVAAGGSGDVSFAVTVDAGLDDPFTVANVAVLHEGDEDTPSNETEHPVAYVGVTKAVDKAEAAYGESLTYTLTVTNPSAAGLTEVVLSDPLPEGTAFVSASDGGTCDDPCTTVTWPAVDLAVGGTFERTFVVRIVTPAAAADGAIAASEIVNSGSVDSAETPSEPSNEVVTTVTAVLGVKIVKPPALPATGNALPVPQSVALAIGLLLAGAGLTTVRRPVTVEEENA